MNRLSLLPCPSTRGGRCRRGFVFGWRRFTRADDPCDHLSNWNVGTGNRSHSGEDSIRRSFHFDYCFVGFYFEERFALGNTFAFFFSPGNKLTGFLRHFEGGHYHAEGHIGLGWKRPTAALTVAENSFSEAESSLSG